MNHTHKLEEKNNMDTSQMLRELLRMPANRFCFECGQRGPTYANITDGSFCCTTCSGILRGLNPPRRVKSISLSVFTQDEINKLRNMGNEENAKIWLGLCDTTFKFEPRVENEIRQHLIQKYEEKRWYVSLDELAEQKRLLESLSERARRDSDVISKISLQSGKSNHSAPPNLHTQSSNTIDLLTGDMITNLNNSPTCQKPMPRSSSLYPTTIPKTKTPETHLMKSLANKEIDDHFSSSFANSSKICVENPVPRIPFSKPVYDGSVNFAKSEIKSASHVFNKSESIFGSAHCFEDSFVDKSTEVKTKTQNDMPVSLAALENNEKTPNKKNMNYRIENQDPNLCQKPSINRNPDSGILPDGRPIMSRHEELPDYSALEELFRTEKIEATNDQSLYKDYETHAANRNWNPFL